nr:agamous-like MADS-box protein AGL61 [Malus domestica]
MYVCMYACADDIRIIIMGKNKIDIKKINNKNYLKATFSKRRKGLFRKATDLCCLTGATLAVIAFSPGNKPFLFGHPSAESVIDRFLAEQARCASDDRKEEVLESGSAGVEHKNLESSREEEKEGGQGMDEENGNFWWEEPIDEGLELPELKKYKSLLERLRENGAIKLDEMNRRELCTKDYFGMNWGFEVGSSSSTPSEERDV